MVHNIIEKKSSLDLAQRILNGSEDISSSDFSHKLVSKMSLIEESSDDGLKKNDSIGIWREKLVNDRISYERKMEAREEWSFWSRTQTIPAKSDKKRVVYLGESVARGMFYDPEYCPAKLLEDILKLNDTSDGEFEVIDLARTNMDYTMLKKITHDCQKLDPDVLVVFAGNNWIYSIQRSWTQEDLEEVLKESETGNAFGCIEKLMIQKFREVTKEYLTLLNKIKDTLGIPIFFVVPEYNLFDWKSSKAERIISSLTEKKLEEWISLKKLVESSAQGEEIKKNAEKMIQLDRTNPYGYEALAQFFIAEENWEKAKEVLQKAKDTNIFGRCASKPRVHSITQEMLRTHADKIDLVDVPLLFKERNLLPNRELFLDYCHMTEKGIVMTMSNLGKQILQKVSDIYIEENQIRFKYKPTDEIRGNAYVNAAIHNAHYGQGKDVLTHLCANAVSVSPRATEFIKAYMDMASYRTSTALCRGQEEIIEKGFSEQYGGTGIIHKPNEKLMDIKLVDAMATVMTKNDETIPKHVHSLRLQNHGVNNRKINLLQPCYSRDSYDVFKAKRTKHFEARDSSSMFYILTEGTSKLVFNLTYRTQRIHLENSPITLTLTDEFICNLKPSPRWSTQEFEIAPSLQKKGVNILRIEWPAFQAELVQSSDTNFEKSQETILRDLYPILGEIHVFTVKMINE